MKLEEAIQFQSLKGNGVSLEDSRGHISENRYKVRSK